MVMNPPSELRSAFVPRPMDASKRTVGTVTVVGGSGHYIHAPVIAGLGARAAGAGLVQLVVPDASRIAAGALVPEATFTKLVSTCVPPKADVMVVGMGLGLGVNTELLVSRLLSSAASPSISISAAFSISFAMCTQRLSISRSEGSLDLHAGRASCRGRTSRARKRPRNPVMHVSLTSPRQHEKQFVQSASVLPRVW